MSKTIDLDDPDLEYGEEYNPFVDVSYKGERFTGVIRSEIEMTEYLDGYAQGQNICYYKDGSVLSTSVYDRGQLVSSKTFFRNGTLRSESIIAEKSYKIWNLDSILVQENETTYFTNGVCKSRYLVTKDGNRWHQFFTKKGDLIYTERDNILKGNVYVRNISYERETMEENYFELMIYENKELKEEQTYDTAESGRIHLIWMWFWEVFDQQPKHYIEILNRLLKHPSLEVKQTIASIIAIHKLNSFIEPENESNAEAYSYIKTYTESQDKKFPNREFKKIVL